MINKETTKELAKFLSSELPDVKLSKILELISKFNGYKDWNTFQAIANISNYNNTDPKWTEAEYVHIDNGGYSFAYNESRKLLYVNTNFYGYSDNNHYFFLSKNDIKDLIHDIKKVNDFYKSVDDFNEENFVIKHPEGKWVIDAFNITLFSSLTDVSLMRSTPNKSKKIINILETYL